MRLAYEHFNQRFRALDPRAARNGGKALVEALSSATGGRVLRADAFRLGKTKIFMRTELASDLELKRDAALTVGCAVSASHLTRRRPWMRPGHGHFHPEGRQGHDREGALPHLQGHARRAGQGHAHARGGHAGLGPAGRRGTSLQRPPH
jgi:hypothetical protein